MSQYWWPSQTSKLICIEVIHVKPLFVMTYIYIYIHVNQHRFSKYNPYVTIEITTSTTHFQFQKMAMSLSFDQKNNQGTGSVPSTCHTAPPKFARVVDVTPPQQNGRICPLKRDSMFEGKDRLPSNFLKMWLLCSFRGFGMLQKFGVLQLEGGPWRSFVSKIFLGLIMVTIHSFGGDFWTMNILMGVP